MKEKIAKIVKDEGEDIEALGTKSNFIRYVKSQMSNISKLNKLQPLNGSAQIDADFIRENREFRHLLCVARYFLLATEFGVSHDLIEDTIEYLTGESRKGICTAFKDRVIIGETKETEWKGSDNRPFNAHDIWDMAMACAHRVYRFDRNFVDASFMYHLAEGAAPVRRGRKMKSPNASLLELASTRQIDTASMERIKAAKRMFFGDDAVSPEIATFLQLYFWRMERFFLFALSKKVSGEEKDPMIGTDEEAVVKIRDYIREILPDPADWEEVYARDLMHKSKNIDDLMNDLDGMPGGSNNSEVQKTD